MSALRSKRSTLVAAALASGVTSLPTTALGVALPTLHSQFQANVNELQWMLTAYSLVYAAFLITAGRLGDMFGHRRLLIWGAAIFLAGSVAGALADSPLWLIVSLAVIGAGGAMLVPASLAVLTNAFSGPARTSAIAIWGAASGFISGMGPPIGGLLTDELSWRWIFWMHAAVALTVLLISVTRVAESKDEEAGDEIDIAGVACLAGAITLLALPLIEGSAWGWGSPAALVSFGAAAALVVAFFAAERRAANPIFELDLFRHRNFALGAALKFSMNFVMTSLFFLLPIYMQEVLGYSPTESGILLLPLSATFLAGLPIGSRLYNRVGPRLPMLCGLALMAGGVYFLADLETSRSSGLWPPLLVLGLGLGVVLTPLNAAAFDAVPTEKHGEAAGILSTMIAVGSVMGVAVCGAVFKELEDGKLERLLRPSGFTEHNERQLEGVLVHSPPAEHALHAYPIAAQHRIVDAIEEAFRYGVESSIRLSAALLLLTLVLTAFVLRKARRAPLAEASASIAS